MGYDRATEQGSAEVDFFKDGLIQLCSPQVCRTQISFPQVGTLGIGIPSICFTEIGDRLKSAAVKSLVKVTSCGSDSICSLRSLVKQGNLSR